MRIYKRIGIPTFIILIVLSLFNVLSLYAQEGSYIKEARESAVFLYDSHQKPCEPAPPDTNLYPLGTGFIVGLKVKTTPLPDGRQRFYKFVITAAHVIGQLDSITLRLNKIDGEQFACFPIKLVRQGAGKNVFNHAKKEVDLVAISIGDISDTDPRILDYSLILDEIGISKQEVREGTDIFTVGYLYGYSGLKQNYPVTKFGKVAVITREYWYRSRERSTAEQAYVVELQNVPGLSGAPVMVLSPQFRVDPDGSLLFRRIPPFIIGVIKGVLLSPIGGTQGLAAIEPGQNLRDLLYQLADALNKAGVSLDLGDLPEEPPKSSNQP